MQTLKITIEDNKLNLEIDGSITWPEACLALMSTVKNLAQTTVAHLAEDNELTPEQTQALLEDVADQINFAASNVLNDLVPPKPDQQLSEAAIAAAENIIIKEAASRKISIEDAIAQAEELLRPYLHGSPSSDAV